MYLYCDPLDALGYSCPLIFVRWKELVSGTKSNLQRYLWRIQNPFLTRLIWSITSPGSGCTYFDQSHIVLLLRQQNHQDNKSCYLIVINRVKNEQIDKSCPSHPTFAFDIHFFCISRYRNMMRTRIEVFGRILY